MPRYIEFEQVDDGLRKTKCWAVQTKPTLHENWQKTTILGYVKWFGRWRGYAFFPAAETVFEQDCLRDIANFVQHETKKHKTRNEKLRSSFTVVNA